MVKMIFLYIPNIGATKTEGMTYEGFVKELRTIFKRIKNTQNKGKSRKKIQELE